MAGRHVQRGGVESDIVKARSFNITRIAGVFTPLLSGIAVTVAEIGKKEPFNDAGFQRQLILALIGLVALVSTADVIARAIAAKRANADAQGVLPKPVTASLPRNGEDDRGVVVAMRLGAAGTVRNNGTRAVTWQPESTLELELEPARAQT